MADVLQAPPLSTVSEPGFAARHIGPSPAEQAEMLAAVGAPSVALQMRPLLSNAQLSTQDSQPFSVTARW